MSPVRFYSNYNHTLQVENGQNQPGLSGGLCRIEVVVNKDLPIGGKIQTVAKDDRWKLRNRKEFTEAN
jgi:hypothetical protein